jgi:hypothetical protein
MSVASKPFRGQKTQLYRIAIIALRVCLTIIFADILISYFFFFDSIIFCPFLFAKRLLILLEVYIDLVLGLTACSFLIYLTKQRGRKANATKKPGTSTGFIFFKFEIIILLAILIAINIYLIFSSPVLLLWIFLLSSMSKLFLVKNLLLQQIIGVLIKVICLLVSIAYFTVAERKVMAAVQRRKGPNVVGFWGLLQPLADGLKLLLKEVIVPSRSNALIFIVAPIMILTLSLVG